MWPNNISMGKRYLAHVVNPPTDTMRKWWEHITTPRFSQWHRCNNIMICSKLPRHPNFPQPIYRATPLKPHSLSIPALHFDCTFRTLERSFSSSRVWRICCPFSVAVQTRFLFLPLDSRQDQGPLNFKAYCVLPRR